MIKRAFKFYVDFEKEEVWLNEMAAKGWGMKSFVGGLYEFAQIEPGEWIYRLEMLSKPARSRDNDGYFKFLEGTGVEIVSTWYRWVYYRRRAEAGAFDVYSDVDSKIKHYKTICAFMAPVVFILSYALFINATNYANTDYRAAVFVFITAFNFCFATAALAAVVKTIVKSFYKIKKLEKEKTLRE